MTALTYNNNGTKFGFNQNKTEGGAVQVINTIRIIFLSSQDYVKMKPFALMAGTKLGFGSVSIHASDQ